MNYMPADKELPDQDPVTVASAVIRPSIGNRGLLFYPVSMGNPSHQGSKLYASLGAIKDIKHPDTGLPNLVIHITDAIYAFNYMIRDPSLTYEAARTMAATNGRNWVNENLTIINGELGFLPIVMYWRQWEDIRGTEYRDVLKQLTDMCNPKSPKYSPAFYKKVQEDSEGYIARHTGLSNTGVPEEAKRVRELSEQFVVHECAGYVLIGRHVIEDYLSALANKEPRIEQRIRDTGGLSDGIIRLYPGGGELKAIKWLKSNPPIRGAEKVRTVSIVITSNAVSENATLQPLHMARLGERGAAIKTETAGARERKHHGEFANDSHRPSNQRYAGLNKAFLAGLKAS